MEKLHRYFSGKYYIDYLNIIDQTKGCCASLHPTNHFCRNWKGFSTNPFFTNRIYLHVQHVIFFVVSQEAYVDIAL